MNLQLATDEYGSLLCPLPGCDKPLYLVRSYSIPLYTDAGLDDNYDGTQGAVSDSWEVSCEHDHTLRTSGDIEGTADDTHPVFDVRRFMEGRPMPKVCGHEFDADCPEC